MSRKCSGQRLYDLPVGRYIHLMRHVELFVSTVSDEFRSFRHSLSDKLKRPNVDIHVQEDFIATGTDTLDKLDSYIARCDAVIHIAGDMTGSKPGPATMVALRARHSDLADRLPPLKASVKSGDQPISYTQWEAYLAVYHRKPLVIAVPDPGTPRDATYRFDTGDQASQRAHVERLRALGHYAEIKFQSADQLAAEVLRSSILDLLAQAGVVTRPIVLPYPSIGRLFKGRAGLLQRLHEGRPRAAGTALVCQALYGLGGIGKTRTAVEYAWAQEEEYTAVLFVEAGTLEALRRTLTAHCGRLMPTLDTTDDALRFRAVLDWLSANSGWLLILDNVDTTAAMAAAQSLLGDLAGGHVIITSRLANFPGHVEPIELGVLSADEGVALLLDRTRGRRRATADDEAKARKVAEDLGWLALALEQAAAYVSRRRSFDDYLNALQSNRDEVLTSFDETVTGYPNAVAITWRTSIQQLTDAGRQLLERIAWLAPEKIPEFLLDVAIPSAEGENLHQALDDVAAYSLVMRDAEGPYFLVHRLVQDVTRRSLPHDLRQRRHFDALGWIDAAFPDKPHDVRYWPRAEALAPHALAVTDASSAEDHVATAVLLSGGGSLFWSKGLYTDARAAPSASARYRGEKPWSRPSCCRHEPQQPGPSTAATNRLVEAELIYRRALAIDEKSLGPDHPAVCSVLNNLAGLLQHTNRLSEAEPLYRRALAIGEENLGPDHLEIATRLNNLASCCNTPTGSRSRAALSAGAGDRREEPWSRSSHVATRLNNLALLLKATNRLSEAEPLYRRALAIDEKSLGPDHPHVATDLNNLALLLRDTSRLSEAEPLLQRALAIDEKSLGPDHPDVATSLNNLAKVLQDTNRLHEAEPLYRRALAIQEKSLGPDHPDIATSLDNLAGLLQNTDRLHEAGPLYRRALAIDEKSFGPNHPRVATGLNNLAGLLQDTDRLERAEPLLRRALAINEKSLGPEHPEVATNLNSLASLLQAAARFDEAEPLLRRALAINEKSLGPNHPRVATGLNNLGVLLVKINRLNEAKSLFQRAVAVLENALGPEHPRTVATRENLRVLSRRGLVSRLFGGLARRFFRPAIEPRHSVSLSRNRSLKAHAI